MDRLNGLATRLEAGIDDIDQQLAHVTARLRDLNAAASSLKSAGCSEPEALFPADLAWRKTRAPTLPAMIIAVVAQAPVTAQSILVKLREQFVTDIPYNHFYPTLWRMHKAGRIERSGDLYSCINSE